MATAWVRFAAPSLRKADWACSSTVLLADAENHSRFSHADFPDAVHASTSRVARSEVAAADPANGLGKPLHAIKTRRAQ